MSVRTFLHIGFHKTGSTSIQHFCWNHRQRLADAGVRMFEGAEIASNHVELHVAAMRAERMSPIKLARRLQRNERYRTDVQRRVDSFLAAASDDSVLFSAEGLSYLRYPDELEWLKAQFPGEVQVIACLRERNGFREAYRHTLNGIGFAESDEPHSVSYLADDSWLLDLQGRLTPFRDTFGSPNVTCIDYDEEVQRRGNIIPAFLEAIGVAACFEPADWSGVFLNRRT